MILTEDQRKRGVGTARTLWPRDANGELHIPYVINADSKFIFYKNFTICQYHNDSNPYKPYIYNSLINITEYRINVISNRAFNPFVDNIISFSTHISWCQYTKTFEFYKRNEFKNQM